MNELLLLVNSNASKSLDKLIDEKVNTLNTTVSNDTYGNRAIKTAIDKTGEGTNKFLTVSEVSKGIDITDLSLAEKINLLLMSSGKISYVVTGSLNIIKNSTTTISTSTSFTDFGTYTFLAPGTVKITISTRTFANGNENSYSGTVSFEGKGTLDVNGGGQETSTTINVNAGDTITMAYKCANSLVTKAEISYKIEGREIFKF